MLNNDRVTQKQIQLLIIIDLFAAGALSMPRFASEFAQEDGWIVIIGAAALATVYGLLITSLIKKFPHCDLIDMATKITNKYIAKVLGVLFLLKLIVSVAYEVRIFGELAKQTLLTKTPIEIIMLMMLIVSVYLARKGYECRARLGEIFIYLVFIPIIIILVFAMTQVKITNLFPVFVAKPKKIFEGIFYLSFKYSALELLILAYAFATNTKKVTRKVVGSIWIVAGLNLLLFTVTIGIFGAKETANNLWPVMVMMQVINIPVLFVERQDALLSIFWVFAVFAYMSGAMFFSGMLLQKILNQKTFKHLILPLVPIVYFVALIASNVVQAYSIMNLLYKYVGLLFLLVVPVLLLFVCRIRRSDKHVEKQN